MHACAHALGLAGGPILRVQCGAQFSGRALLLLALELGRRRRTLQRIDLKLQRRGARPLVINLPKCVVPGARTCEPVRGEL